MRISEIYLSVQGEGPRVGEPTVFIRFAGCNLRCPGWPCDTPHAIFPEKFRGEWKKMSVDEIEQEVTKLTQDLMYFNVCLTGGEPFLQNHTQLEQLVIRLRMIGAVTVECFSNGTIAYPDWIKRHDTPMSALNFIMDWKLRGSGEDPEDSVRIENVKKFFDYDAVKFVIKNRQDYEEAKHFYGTYLEDQFYGEVYYGAVWNEITNAQLVSWVLEDGLPWRLNVQMHNYIWDRRKRGI